MNPRLRLAITNARNENMPNNNIEKAIRKGTGDLEGVNYEQNNYEGYGPGGVAIFLETLTDNSKRTVSDIRHVFSKHGGHLAETGSVAWMFEQKGLIEILNENLDEDELMMAALEAGAEDLENEDDRFLIFTEYSKLHEVLAALEKEDFKIEKAELTRIPKNTINADEFAEKLIRLIEQLEDLDDVQKVFANYEISDEVFAEMEN